MSQILSIFFNIDRTYLSISEPTTKGLSLSYINSTLNYIDLENLDDDGSVKGIEELDMILSNLDFTIDKVDVTIPAESVLVTQFPGRHGMSELELSELIALEIRQAYPQFNPNDFSSNIIPMADRLDGQTMMLAVIIPFEIIKSVHKILGKYDIPIDNIEISQLNAQNSFLYNYPENIYKTTAIVGVQNNFIDLSIVKNMKPIYYDLISFTDKNQIGILLLEEFDILNTSVANDIEDIFFFGTGLTNDVLTVAQQTFDGTGINHLRLNAFRMVSTKLTEREIEYCSRTMHIYPPCIGGSFKSYHDRIKLY
jgi:hypothetical protein